MSIVCTGIYMFPKDTKIQLIQQNPNEYKISMVCRVLLKNRYICIVMDFDDFVKYELLFNDDEPPRRSNIPPSDNGSGCLTSCIIVVVFIISAFIWS